MTEPLKHRKEHQASIPIWIDCDPGHDDAFAILLACANQQLRLLGVSTVHGNAAVEATTANARSILDAIRRADVPVYMGAASPQRRAREGAEEFHGSSGLAGTDLLPARTVNNANSDVSAVQAMRDALMAQPRHTAWLVAIAPLTNIAELLARYPEVADWIQGATIMGGALGGGYTKAVLGKHGDEGELVTYPTRWAEFNIWCDPEAAAAVLGHQILAPKTILVTLDLTHQAIVSTMMFQRDFTISQDPTPGGARQMFLELLQHNSRTYQSYFPSLLGPPLHDPVAVALILPDCRIEADGETFQIEVITEGEERGRTKAIAVAQGDGVWIPREIKMDNFQKMLADALDAAERLSQT